MGFSFDVSEYALLPIICFLQRIWVTLFSLRGDEKILFIFTPTLLPYELKIKEAL